MTQRDRGDLIPEPELVGPAPDDFDPDKVRRVVDPRDWGASLRAVGPPEALPETILVTFDRSIIRRGSASVGAATRLRLEGPGGGEVSLGGFELTDDDTILRADIEGELQPGARYEATLSQVELIFQRGSPTREEDAELVELSEPPQGSLRAPPLELIDASPARPVGAFGHVELRFSAPVRRSDLDDALSWSLGGQDPVSVTYNGEESGRVFDVRLRAPGVSFSRTADPIELRGGGVTSPLGGEALDEIDETLSVGESSDGLEIRSVGTYERAGDAAIRVICHDPTLDDTTRSYWDRDISTRVRDVSRRCDADLERVLERVEIGGDIDASAVDHARGFDLILRARDLSGPVGVAVRTGDLGADAPPLYEGHEEVIEPAGPGPELAIDADGRYLEREDWHNIPLRHRGVELARVVVRHTGEELFPFWLSGGDSMGARTSRAVAEGYIELDPSLPETRYSYFDMEEIVGEPEPGVYQVEVSAPYRRGLSDAHRFIVSDLQLVAKRASHQEEEVDEIWAWAVEAERAEPAGGVDLELVRQNGEVLAACETNDDGFCQLAGNWGDLENEPPFAVVAEGAGELAYVDWEDTKTEIARGSVGGMDYAHQPPHRGVLRGERTLYRPGETMRLAAFVRDEDGAAAPELPVGVEIRDARGSEVYGGLYETDAAGAFEFDYALPELASTGTWRVEIFTGDETIARQRVSVEEFVPERLEVEVDVDDTYVARGGGLEGAVQADYFFGVPAAGADFEIECRFSAGRPFDDAFPDYHFGPFSDDVDGATARTSGSLDEGGESAFRCDPPGLDAGAPYEVEIEAAVFEAGSGNASRESASSLYLPGDPLVGLRSPDRRVDVDDGARVEGVLVGADGEVAPDAEWVELELGGVRYSTTRVHRDGRTRWERERHVSVDERKRLALEDGRFSTRVPPRGLQSGVYVRAARDGAETQLEISPPRRFWGWGRRDVDPRPDDPTHIEIEGPEEIAVGDEAEFSFEAPASGRALVAVETYRVETWEWLDVDAGENSWEVELEHFEPNVYVSALFIPSSEDAPLDLDRGFGVKRVDVAREPWEADVDIEVPDEREPGDTLTARVDAEGAGDEARAVVAAVDRGILSMARHEFDHPLDQIFATRALAVDTFDTVGWYADVAPEVFGGGAAPGEAGPDPIMPVEPTSEWSGLVDVSGGRAEVEFEIPDYRGELEIIAVVVGDERLGEASGRTTIRDPLALQATPPRFATRGDEIEVPVQVTNTTERAIDVRVEADVVPDEAGLGAGAELAIAGSDAAALELAPEEQGIALFDVSVDGSAGAPALLFTASGGGERSEHEATVPIYPRGAKTTEHVHHEVRGAQFDVSAELEGWLPTSETTQLWLTSVPHAPAFEHLERVLRYPRLPLGANIYNTIARVRPAVFLDRLLAAADPEGGGRSVRWRVNRGIRGVERLQLSSGRFSFWSSVTAPVGVWGQAYVLDMLASARDAGHDVPEWVLRDAADWLDRRVQRREDLEDLDLAVWVLARMGRPHRRAARAIVDDLPARPSGRDHERALLATAALYAAGDETVRDDLRALVADPAIDEGTREAAGTLYSAARHEGLALEIGIESFGADHDVLSGLATDVAARLTEAELGDLNLHELGWSIAGLGRWAEARMGEIPDARLLAGGREIDPEVVGDDGSRAWELHRASEYEAVTLELEEAAADPVTLFRRTEGVPEGAPPPRSGSEGGLRVRRALRGPDGERVRPGDLEIGDVAFVEIEAENELDHRARSLALTAPVAAGFEIEDPRPSGAQRPDWLGSGGAWGLDHIEVRDDRIEAFGSIGAERTTRLVYRVRATTAGSFGTRPTELRSMYVPDRWARAGGEAIQIERR